MTSLPVLSDVSAPVSRAPTPGPTVSMPVNAALLVLADGRFPAGAHAHSFGVEAACALAGLADLGSLDAFVRARLATVGRVEAAFSAATCARLQADAPTQVPWGELDAELAARTASPVVRAASRSLGRQLLRAGERVWPSPAFAVVRAGGPPDGPLQPVALGAVAHAAGLGALDAAMCSLYHLVTATTTAAVRLLGLDPFEVTALVARLADELAQRAGEAEAHGAGAIRDLPATTGLLADVLAEHHATWEVRLFAS